MVAGADLDDTAGATGLPLVHQVFGIGVTVAGGGCTGAPVCRAFWSSCGASSLAATPGKSAVILSTDTTADAAADTTTDTTAPNTGAGCNVPGGGTPTRNTADADPGVIPTRTGLTLQEVLSSGECPESAGSVHPAAAGVRIRCQPADPAFRPGQTRVNNRYPDASLNPCAGNTADQDNRRMDRFPQTLTRKMPVMAAAVTPIRIGIADRCDAARDLVKGDGLQPVKGGCEDGMPAEIAARYRGIDRTNDALLPETARRTLHKPQAQVWLATGSAA